MRRNVCLEILSNFLVMDDLEAIKQLFINFDADKNGTISNKELQAFIDSISGKILTVNRGCNRLFEPKFIQIN